MTDATTRIVALMDDVLLAIVDGKPIDRTNLRSLPPWRASMLAQVAAKAGMMDQAEADAIHAEAGDVGGLGTLPGAGVDVALVEKLADAVSLAAEFFNARDEMHGAVMRPAVTDGIPHQAPITAVMNDAMEAWRAWKFG